MMKKRRGAAKATFGQQQAELKRSARGKRFVGDDTGSAQGKAAERAKVLRMQMAAREAEHRAAEQRHAEQVHEERAREPLWHLVGGFVVDSAKLATTLAALPFRFAKLPFRMAAAFWAPRTA